MKKASDILMTILFVAILLGPGIMYACEKTQVGLPSWATSEDARWLSGGVKEVGLSSSMSLQAFSMGDFQEALTDEVNGRIPFKAIAMLGNAALQRSLIAAANLPLGYDAYPTFYGSGRLYIPSQDAVTYPPYKRNPSRINAIEAFGERLAAFAERHPDNRFVVCLVQAYQEPAVNPAYGLITNPVDPSEYARVLESAIGDIDNVLVYSQSYDTLDGYYRDFFRTDHHWNHLGIERAYNAMAPWLGLTPFLPEGEIDFGEYRYIGTTARVGLCWIEEKVSTTTHDYSGLVIVRPDGSTRTLGHREASIWTNPGARYDFYGIVHSGFADGGAVLGYGTRKAIVICNSFGAGMIRYLATDYASVALLSQMPPPKRDPSLRMESLLDEGGYDDVFFIANATDLGGYSMQCPELFAPVQAS